MNKGATEDALLSHASAWMARLTRACFQHSTFAIWSYNRSAEQVEKLSL